MACADNCKRAADPLASGVNYAQCGGYALRSIDSSDVTSYAQRSGAAGGDQLCYVSACLLTGRLIYWKNAPGDCPKATKISLGFASKTSKIAGLGLTGVAAASSVSLAATGGAGAGASAGGAGATLGGLPALAGTIATGVGLAVIPLAIWGFISAHHKIAVAREQATGCDVSQAYDQWELTVEDAIRSGRMSVADAKAAVPQVEQQLRDALRAIRKECNTACFQEKALVALDLYAVEVLYDSLKPSRLIRNIGIAALAGAGVFGAVKLAGAAA